MDTVVDANGPQMRDVTLRDLLSPIFRHSRVVIFVFVGITTVAVLVAWLWAATYYKSSMQILVEQDRSDPAVTSAQNAAVYSNKPVTVDLVTSELGLILGEDMLRKVSVTCGLADKPSLFDFALPRDPSQRAAMKVEMAARSLAKKIKVKAANESDVIEVSYGHAGEPTISSCVLQNLSKLYLEKHLILQRPTGSSDFFAEQTEHYAQALAQAEKNLVDYDNGEKVAAPDVLQADIAQQLATSQGELYSANQTIAADIRRIRAIESQLSHMQPRSETAQVSNSSSQLIQTLQASLLASQVKQTELRLKYNDDYPLVREANQEIAETEAAIAKAQRTIMVDTTTDRDPTYEILREDVAKTQADLAGQEAQAAAIRNTIKTIQAQMISLEGQAVKQASLEREVKANETSYLLYLNKREQERTSDGLDKRHIANVAIAVPPITSMLPAYSPWLVMFLGIVVGGIVGVTAAYVTEYVDPSFRNSDDVMNVLNVPILISIPRQAA